MLRTILGSAVAVALLSGAAQAEYALTILHTNDFHARFEPISKFDSACSAEDAAAGACFGGVARLVTAIAEARRRSDNVLLVDGGDQFQGTLFYTRYLGAASAEFMNALGYEAMAVGNHEFDNGPQALRDFAGAVGFPLLMANGDVSAEPLLADRIAKSVVIEKNGERLGLIGLTPRNNGELASPGPNINFTDPVGAVQQEVDALTAEGITRIILLSHSGHEVDKRLAAETTGVDVIVGGHSHTLLSNVVATAAGPYPTMVDGTAIVSAYAYGKYLGELNVVFDDAGVLVSAAGEPVLLDASVAEDAPTVARVAELAAPLEEIRNRVVAEAATGIDGSRDSCRAGECAMGNLIADAMLARVADQGVTIALQNGGGVRASIDAGPVTMGEVLTVLPFQNTLSTFEATGATVLAALENGVSEVADGAGRFLQVAGLKYSFDAAAPVGSRVSEVMVAEGGTFVPLDPARTYLLVSNNFVRNGGDGFTMFRDAANAYDFGPDLADVVAEYLAAAGSYTAYTDGRITAK